VSPQKKSKRRSKGRVRTRRGKNGPKNFLLWGGEKHKWKSGRKKKKKPTLLTQCGKNGSLFRGQKSLSKDVLKRKRIRKSSNFDSHRRKGWRNNNENRGLSYSLLEQGERDFSHPRVDNRSGKKEVPCFRGPSLFHMI